MNLKVLSNISLFLILSTVLIDVEINGVQLRPTPRPHRRLMKQMTTSLPPAQAQGNTSTGSDSDWIGNDLTYWQKDAVTDAMHLSLVCLKDAIGCSYFSALLWGILPPLKTERNRRWLPVRPALNNRQLEMCDESVLKMFSKYPKDMGSLRSKKKDEAVQILDYKCIDLNKKLDLLRHQNRVRQAKLKRLADEHRELITKTVSKQTRKVATVRAKPICLLENQIHRVEMNMMEAEHVNKKYKTIRTHLLSDSVEFESSLRQLEQSIQKQDSEIKHLEVVNREALGLRDITKGTLLRQEISALNAGKSRDHQLQEFRHRVEERKMELENLERRIFPPGRAVVHQDSQTGEGGHGAGSEATNQLMSQLDASFAKLKIATGESDTEEVLHRFLSQKETRSRLTYLKTITEEDKRQLELSKEMILGELEAFKFAEVKDKEQSQEEVEKMNNSIDEQRNLKDSHDNEVERITQQLFTIREHLYSFILKLEDFNEEAAPEPTDDINSYIEVLDCLMRKIQAGLVIINMGDTFDEAIKALRQSEEHKGLLSGTLLTEDEGPLFSRFSPVEEGKQQKNAPPSLLLPEDDDEDDVPTRAYLKRQAQLIVDAKSRRKFNRVMNFPRPRK